VRLVYAYSSAGMAEESGVLRKQIEESAEKLCPIDRVYLGFADAMIAKRYREAYREAREALALAPGDPSAVGAVVYLALRLNRPREAVAAVAAAMDSTLAGEDDVKSGGRCPWLRACIAAQRGDRDGAVALLNAALAHGFGTRVNVGFLHVFAFLEPLHGYAPFEELIAPKG
jgi:hypothetical protein